MTVYKSGKYIVKDLCYGYHPKGSTKLLWNILCISH